MNTFDVIAETTISLLWHWGCWLNRDWLILGAAPTWVVGSVFFAGVLRWRLWAEMAAAVVLILIAILRWVAWTVVYQYGFPTWP
jgi:hypothetical protein